MRKLAAPNSEVIINNEIKEGESLFHSAVLELLLIKSRRKKHLQSEYYITGTGFETKPAEQETYFNYFTLINLGVTLTPVILSIKKFVQCILHIKQALILKYSRFYF